jgi:hypothetical protein
MGLLKVSDRGSCGWTETAMGCIPLARHATDSMSTKEILDDSHCRAITTSIDDRRRAQVFHESVNRGNSGLGHFFSP